MAWLKIIKKQLSCTLIISVVSLTMLVPFASYAEQNNAVISPKEKVALEKKAAHYVSPKDAILVHFYPKYPKIEIKSGMNEKLIKRGEYLVKMGDCMACHTDTSNHGKPFAGGLALNTPFGTFFTPNITPDKETGIGKWSTDDFIRAMHEGINPKGQY